MIQLSKPIQSFLTLRTVVLRSLQSSDLSKSELMDVANLSDMKYTNRMAMPDTWTADEIEKLASYLQYGTGAVQSVRQLADHLNKLPKDIRRFILQEAQIDRKKCLIRHKDYNRWKPDELQRIVTALEQLEEKYDRGNIFA